MAAVAVVASIVSAVASSAQQRKQRKAAAAVQAEERRQNALANRQQALERQRQIRQSIAESRVRRAQIESSSFGLGGGSLVGGIGTSITTDTASAIGSANTQMAASSAIAESRDRASLAIQNSQSAFWQNVATGAELFKSASANRGMANFTGIGTGWK